MIQKARLWRGRMAEMLRFGAAGAANTLFSLSVYQLLVTWIHHQIAYLSAWLMGIGFVILIYPAFVYRRPVRRAGGKGAIAGAYVTTYLASAVLLEILAGPLAVPPRLAVLLAIAFSMTANYLLMAAITARWGEQR